MVVVVVERDRVDTKGLGAGIDSIRLSSLSVWSNVPESEWNG